MCACTPALQEKEPSDGQAQEVLSQSGYLSASDPHLHFGLGAATTADIEIHWPSGWLRSILHSPPVSLSQSGKA